MLRTSGARWFIVPPAPFTTINSLFVYPQNILKFYRAEKKFSWVRILFSSLFQGYALSCSKYKVPTSSNIKCVPLPQNCYVFWQLLYSFPFSCIVISKLKRLDSFFHSRDEYFKVFCQHIYFSFKVYLWMCVCLTTERTVCNQFKAGSLKLKKDYNLSTWLVTGPIIRLSSCGRC